MKDRKQVLLSTSPDRSGHMGNLAVSWFLSLLFLPFPPLSLTLDYRLFQSTVCHKHLRCGLFFPCTFQCHYVTLLLNKRLYYVPAPPVKGQKWTQFLSAERINQDYVSWKESQTAVARHCVSVCLSVCVYPPSYACKGWEIYNDGKHLLVLTEMSFGV